MQSAESVFRESLDWFKGAYGRYTFYVERDIVWTLQRNLIEVIARRRLDIVVFNDYRMRTSEALADLVLMGDNELVEVAAEFKFEPDHSRRDIPATKFPVVEWGTGGVLKDLERIQEFTRSGDAAVSYAILIDEGGAFADRDAPPLSRWSHWATGPWVLEGRAER